MISDSVQLLKVEPHRVEIGRSGERVWLSLSVERMNASDPGAQGSAQNAALPAPKIVSQSDSAYRRRVIRLKSGLRQQKNGGRTAGYLVRSADLFDLLYGAGLQEGDVIQSINGNAFSRSEDLEDFAYSWRSGAAHAYTVLRGGKTMTLQ